MTDIAKLGFEIDPRREAARATGDLTKLVGASRLAENASVGLSSKFKLAAAVIGVAFVGALAGAVALMHKFVSATAEQQRVSAQLETTVRSTGMAAGYTAKQLGVMASALQNVTSYGDETIGQGEAILLTFTKIGHDVFPQAVESMLDLSTVMGTDLKSAALQLGKALNDPINQVANLQRSGVSLSKAQQEVIKGLVQTGHLAEAQKIILKELQTEFGGSARAAKDTLGGALKSLGNAWGDVFELSKEQTSGLVTQLNNLTDKLASPDTKMAIQNFGAGLLGVITASFDAFTQLTTAFVNFMEWASAQRPYEVNKRAAAVGAANAAARGETDTGQGFNFGQFFPDSVTKIRVTPPETPGLTDTQKKAAEAYDKLIKSANQRIAQAGLEAQALGMTAEAANRLRVQQELLNKAANDNITLTPKQSSELQGLANQIAATEETTRQLTDAYNFGKDATQGFFSDMKSGLMDGKNLWDSFGNAAVNVLNKIADKALSMAADNIWNSLFGGLTGGLTGGKGGLLGGFIIPGILHAGGIAGADGYGHGRALAASTWADAPRYHDGTSYAGLRPGEVPAILQRGERVIPANQNAGSQTVIRLELSPELVAQILQQAAGQSIQISQQTVAPLAKSMNTAAKRQDAARYG